MASGFPQYAFAGTRDGDSDSRGRSLLGFKRPRCGRSGAVSRIARESVALQREVTVVCFENSVPNSQTVFGKRGSTGDPPVPLGDSPSGMTSAFESEAWPPLLWSIAAIPSGGSPDGTGQWPVLPKPSFRTCSNHVGRSALQEMLSLGQEWASQELPPRLEERTAHWQTSRGKCA